MIKVKNLNIPSQCRGCYFEDEWYCKALNKDVHTYVLCGDKPSYCPIEEVKDETRRSKNANPINT